jgi:flagellar protein FlaF
MHNAAQADSSTSHTTPSRREIEAQALLKAARQLQDVLANWAGPDSNMHKALLYNRRLWSIFMSAAETNDNPQPMQIRQNIANIGIFVLKQTVEMQMDPDPAKLKSLIDINRNLAAGLSGRKYIEATAEAVAASRDRIEIVTIIFQAAPCPLSGSIRRVGEA